MAGLIYTHWYSRLLLNGVPYGAMVETVERVKDWSQWCGEWSRTAEAFESAGDAARASGHRETARDHYLAAAACYHYAEFLFIQDTGLKQSTPSSLRRRLPEGDPVHHPEDRAG